MQKIDPRRIDDAEAQWLSSKPTGKIVRALMDKWGVSRNQALRYLSLARKRVAASAADITPEQRRERAEAMFAEAWEAAQIPNAITGQPNAQAMAAIAHRIAEMHGAIAPERVNIEATIGIAEALSRIAPADDAGGAGDALAGEGALADGPGGVRDGSAGPVPVAGASGDSSGGSE